MFVLVLGPCQTKAFAAQMAAMLTGGCAGCRVKDCQKVDIMKEGGAYPYRSEMDGMVIN